MPGCLAWRRCIKWYIDNWNLRSPRVAFFADCDLLGRWSLLLMYDWRTGVGGGVVIYILCKSLILLRSNMLRFYKTEKIHQHLIVKIVPANMTAHYLYEYSMFYSCFSHPRLVKHAIFHTYLTTDECEPHGFPLTMCIRAITRSLQHKWETSFHFHCLRNITLKGNSPFRFDSNGPCECIFTHGAGLK